MAIRSTFHGLNTMVRGIQTNRMSLDTVGHNIANATTEGYSRQTLNQISMKAQEASGVYGGVLVGSGVDAMNIQRARNVFADKQFWQENSTMNYMETRQRDFDKIEAIFDDSDDNGLQDALGKFWKSWSDLSASASDPSSRITTVDNASTFVDRLQNAAFELQMQITSNYNDLALNITQVNEITDQIVQLNKNILATEANGSYANDLRDQRDLLVDNLSNYMTVNVYESETGMYSVVSNGVSVVNGISNLHFDMSPDIPNEKYGVADHNIMIRESGITFTTTNGIIDGIMDSIAKDKEYFDHMANMAAFMLTSFNAQHQQGVALNDETTGINFFGDDNTIYKWNAEKECVEATQYTVSTTEFMVDKSLQYDSVTGKPTGVLVKDDGSSSGQEVDPTDPTKKLVGIQILNALEVNVRLTESNGEQYVAARSWTVDTDPTTGAVSPRANGTGDGSNAVNIDKLFNTNEEDVFATGNDLTGNVNSRAIGATSLNHYYNKAMTQLGSDSQALDTTIEMQEDIMTQVTNWRSQTSGVDWNDELTNMIMFQTGYSAASRCLTTMDEMLDRLINSTGMVGR